jgi:hypothetical protein
MKSKRVFVITPQNRYVVFDVPSLELVDCGKPNKHELLALLESYSTKKPAWGDPDEFVIDNRTDDKEACYWIGQFRHALKHCGKPVRFTSEWKGGNK